MTARSTIKDLRAHLADIEQRREELTRQLAELERLAEHFRAVIAYCNDRPGEASTEDRPTKAVRNTMVDILKEAGEPLHYRRLHELLLERGVDVKGRDPARNVGAHLSLDTRFKAVGHGKWALASWPPTPNGVKPGASQDNAPAANGGRTAGAVALFSPPNSCDYILQSVRTTLDSPLLPGED